MAEETIFFATAIARGSSAPFANSAAIAAATGARGLSGVPTATQQTNYTIAFEELNGEIAKLRTLEAELKKFEQQLEAAGVPYTPGRWPGQQ